jgi:membrane fusion protein, copper/silver efflux system
MKKIFSHQYVRYALLILGGIFLGWIFFHTSHKVEDKKNVTSAKTKSTIWTCSMHPQIQMDHPGKCPICGMDLIPLNQSSVVVDPAAIHLSKESAQLANVQTSVVSSQNPEMEVRLYGKIQADERLLQSQVAHIPGRIERLMVSFTGESVRKGQTLALIYSPELITAQQELLEAAKTKQSQPEIYDAAKERLHQWKLTDNQIASIESSRKIRNNFEIVANTSGVVTARRVNNGDYVAQGAVLYDIANLSRVWVMFDAYESDLPFLKKGDKVSYTVQALPGKTFTGSIVFIDPVIDATNRISKVRLELANPSGKLKPEMFVTGKVVANLNEYRNKLVIPRSAVLWTGKRSVVYVKQTGTDEFIFKIRSIELGPMLGNSYVVLSGLSEGEEIVTQGAFSVDAAAQLEGKPSMMNSEEEKSSTNHKHGEMEGMDMAAMGSQPSRQAQASTGNTAMVQHVTFRVYGNCEMCKERIEAAAKSVKGVTSATWNTESKQLKIAYKGSEGVILAVHLAVAKVGHDTDKMKSDSKTYKALPECCLYRK